jgi:L-amino acid N-acyltransferase YncA
MNLNEASISSSVYASGAVALRRAGRFLKWSTKMLIRFAQMDDLPAIVKIYNQSIPSKQSTGDTQPVRFEDRMTWFREHRPEEHPIFVADVEGQVEGWCSLSAYRPGRAALRFTAEISYYIALSYHRRGLATALVEHALAACPALQIRHLFAIVLEGNEASLKLLEKTGFEQWGYLPRVADFDGKEVGHLYYGRHV